MTKLNLIFGFRNRSIQMVEKCMESLKRQSFKDFEVLFIDYGSDQTTSCELIQLLNHYPFAKYIFNNTIGMPWNRSHALNTGIKLVKSEYLMTLDVDLIFSENYLQTFYENRAENKVIYSNVYLLPENYQYEEKQTKLKTFQVQEGGSGLGFYPSKLISEIGAYDEYYCFWGCEDRDIKFRLKQNGVEQKVMSIQEGPVYYQWHPTTNFSRIFLPVGWWEDMNYYFFNNKNVLTRNNDSWGTILTEKDRPALQHLNNNFKDHFYNANNYPNLISFFEEISNKFHELKKDDFIKFEYILVRKKFEFNDALPKNTFLKILNKIVYLLNKSYRIVDFYLLNKKFNELNSVNLYEMNMDEIKNFSWKFLRTNEKEIKDYFYTFDNNKIVFVIVKR